MSKFRDLGIGAFGDGYDQKIRPATRAYFQFLRRASVKAFFAQREKTDLVMLFWTILGHFWYPVVTLVTFSSNLGNFEKNSKKPTKKIYKIF